ncbi:MAG TPA: hypothetical protein VFB62_13945 [Polyangiaceae bacterium]|nr:hypothetical protein [Polyangiaceae bacterium]
MKRLALVLAVAGCTPTAVYEPAPPQPAQPEPDKPAPSPPAPVAAKLPADMVAKLEHHAICAPKSCASDRLYPPATQPEPQSPAAMWSQVIESGAKLRISPSARADLYGVVISGSVSVESDKTIELAAWRAFHAPNAGVTLSGNGSLVMALATDGEPVRKAIAGREPVKVTPGAVEVVDLDAQIELRWAKGKARARLGFESGRASFGLLMSDADAPVPEHDHPKSWEVIALLRADGRFKRGDKPGEGEEVTAGRVVAVPIAVRHAWAPSGKQELFAVQMYLPPGPEQRFKEMAAKE